MGCKSHLAMICASLGGGGGLFPVPERSVLLREQFAWGQCAGDRESLSLGSGLEPVGLGLDSLSVYFFYSESL